MDSAQTGFGDTRAYGGPSGPAAPADGSRPDQDVHLCRRERHRQAALASLAMISLLWLPSIHTA